MCRFDHDRADSLLTFGADSSVEDRQKLGRSDDEHTPDLTEDQQVFVAGDKVVDSSCEGMRDEIVVFRIPDMASRCVLRIRYDLRGQAYSVQHLIEERSVDMLGQIRLLANGLVDFAKKTLGETELVLVPHTCEQCLYRWH